MRVLGIVKQSKHQYQLYIAITKTVNTLILSEWEVMSILKQSKYLDIRMRVMGIMKQSKHLDIRMKVMGIMKHLKLLVIRMSDGHHESQNISISE